MLTIKCSWNITIQYHGYDIFITITQCNLVSNCNLTFICCYHISSTEIVIVTCNAPSAPLSGFILPDKSPYQVNEVVTFQCNAGYRLVGSATVMCLQNGVWSVPSPICEGKMSAYLANCFPG